MSDAIDVWAKVHNLTRDQAVEIGVTYSEEDGLIVPVPPHKWPSMDSTLRDMQEGRGVPHSTPLRWKS